MRHILPRTPSIWLFILGIVLILGLSGTGYFYHQHQQALKQNPEQSDLTQQHEQANLHVIQNQSLLSQNNQLQAQIDQLQSELPQQTKSIDQAYKLYQSLQDKLKRNQGLGLDTNPITQKIPSWGQLLLDSKYQLLNQQLSQANSDLDAAYQQRQKEIASKPPANPSSSSPTSTSSNTVGYSQKTISTPVGNFSAKIVQLPLSQYQVRTVSGASSTCTNNCHAQSLSQYVAQNGAYAGINGTYFCPPDYGSCAGKTYSYDFALLNSTNGQWINPNARHWDSTGMITFSGTTANGCRISAECNTSGATAAISNFPPLIVFNNQVQTIAEQSVAQRNRNAKGAIGVNATHVFLVTTSATSLTELGHLMKAIGATHALNLDGGGSQALYVAGSYKAGPGRLLPNAVVLVKR